MPELTFLTPLGALLALGALVPAAAVLAASRRARGVRDRIALSAPVRASLLVPLAALGTLGALVGLAAAQPVVDRTATREVRPDAEAFVVVDVSRSMLARRVRGRTRLERAKEAAVELRAALPDVRVGVASLTDRVLPHQLPSADDAVFEATVADALDVERPPARSSLGVTATSFDALVTVATQRFFSPRSKRRLLFVLTDGESTPVSAAVVGRRLQRPPPIVPIFLHFWDEGERVYTRGVPEAGYRPDPSARATLEALATGSRGFVFGESEREAVVEAARTRLGTGPTVAEGTRRARIALAPYLLGVGFAPLALVLLRRER